VSGKHGMGAQILHELYQRDCGICQICFRFADIRDCNVDHVVPVSKGGTDDMENLQLTHHWCNSRKGSDPNASLNLYWYEKPSKRQLEMSLH
jgi:5-methylcytosine-specific restriction endonuclease McrA